MKTKLVLIRIEFFDMKALEDLLNLNAENGWHPLRIEPTHIVFSEDVSLQGRYVILIDPSQKLEAYGKDALIAKQAKLNDLLSEFDYEIVTRIYNLVVYRKPIEMPHITDTDLERLVTKKDRQRLSRSYIFKNYNGKLMAEFLFLFVYPPMASLGIAMANNGAFILISLVFISVILNISSALFQIVKAVQYYQGKPVVKTKAFRSLDTTPMSWILWYSKSVIFLILSCALMVSNSEVRWLFIPIFLLAIYFLFDPFIQDARVQTGSFVKRLKPMIPQCVTLLFLFVSVFVLNIFGLLSSPLEMQYEVSHFNFPTLIKMGDKETCSIHEDESWFYKTTVIACDDSMVLVSEAKSFIARPFLFSAARRITIFSNVDQFVENEVVIGRMFPFEYLKSGDILVFSMDTIPDNLVQDVINR